jgi:type II secretory pathway pseudopilin PulG
MTRTVTNRPGWLRAGTTLLELLAALVIIAVIADIALPAAANFYTGQKSAAAAATLVVDVRRARYAALQEQRLYRLAFFRGHRVWGDGYVVSFYRPTTDPDDTNLVPPWALRKALVADHDPLNDDQGADQWIPVDGPDGVRVLPDGLKPRFIPDPPPPLFFRADGTIHRHPNDPQPIGSITVELVSDDDTSPTTGRMWPRRHDGALSADTGAFAVNISTVGAIESDTWNEEPDDEAGG